MLIQAEFEQQRLPDFSGYPDPDLPYFGYTVCTRSRE
jgi:hypothetical protein